MPIGSTALPVDSLPDLSVIRESRGIKLEDISSATKISRRYLEAIERRDFGLLPGGVFNTSYLRQYARAVDLDEWELLACYEARTQPPNPPAEPPVSRWARFALPLLKRLAPARRI